MGLDVSVIKTRNNTNLSNIYAIRDVVDNVFNWYLGDNQENKRNKYDELVSYAKSLTKDTVVEKVTNEGEKNYLKSIPDDEFKADLEYVIGSIGDFSQSNSHLFFEYDKLPGKTIFDSCDWGLRDTLFECSTSERNVVNTDTVVELDSNKLKKLAKMWKSYGFKLNLIKWVSYFFPDAGDRMFEDFLDTHSVMPSYINDLLYCRKMIIKVAKSIEPGTQLWLISSY